MKHTANGGISTATGSFRAPEQLVDDVRQRDREWEAWERDSIQCVANQLSGLLSKNYPGNGWFRIRLKPETYNQQIHSGIVYTAMCSAFGGDLKGLRDNICLVFTGIRWRVRTKVEDYGWLNFDFHPLEEPLAWYESKLGWVSPVATVSENLDVSALRAPPSAVRPNNRGQNNNFAKGVTVSKSESSSKPDSQPFPYDNLC
jgi:hypothetical protein